MPRSDRRLSAVVLVVAPALVVAMAGAPAARAQAATTLTVTTTADLTAPCQPTAFSLRCALVQANADGSGDTISFHIPSSDPGCSGTSAVCTIRPGAALPTVTASDTVVDGYSQPGASPNTQPLSAGDNAVITIHLDGSRAGIGVNGLVLAGARDTVRGLSITGFQVCNAPAPQCNTIPGLLTGGSGVEVRGMGDVVAGSFLGVLPDGTTAGPNQFAGVNIVNREPFLGAGPTVGQATIGGTTPAASNVLSGNSDCVGGSCYGFGVYIFSGSGSVIARNYIGTTASGTAPLTNTATGVVILTPNNTLGGLTAGAGNVISSSGGDGVLIAADGDVVAGNLIGTTAAGNGALGNRSHGVDVQFPSTSATISHNVISANGDTGLVLETSGTVVQGNRVGTNAAGSAALGNGFNPSAIFLGQPINGTDGIVVCAGPNTIGGTAAGSGNLVSGNAGDGISLVSSNNVVQGNIVGTNAVGTAALPNGIDGIGSMTYLFRGSGFCEQAATPNGNDNTIGGTAAGAGNLVSGNSGNGVVIVGTDNVVAGNRIGVTAAGTAGLGNGGSGVVLTGVCVGTGCVLLFVSSNNTIGGTSPGAGNVISANGANGILINGFGGGLSNVVQGNRIGTDASGFITLGNQGNGVFVVNGAVDDSVGGTVAGAGNVIAHNGGAGVLFGASAADTGTHSSANQNAIFANGGLGVDLAPRGSVNCATSPPGPNDYTPCPLIQQATTLSVSGTACPGCTVEVYVAAAQQGDQGHGEGQSYLGSVTAAGDGTWSLTLAAGQVLAGQQVTATATTAASFEMAAETSEFAANVTVD